MGESYKYDIEFKKADTQKHILCDSISIKFKRKQNYCKVIIT